MDFCCILCRNQRYRVLYQSTIEPRSSASELYVSTGRPIASHGQIVICTNCEMVSTFPRDDEKLVGAAYQALADPEYLAERQARLITAQRHLKLVHRFNPTQGNLLDVGCSTGFFLSVAQKHGWHVVGIEPSHWASEIARSEYGIKSIHEGFLEQLELDAAEFDVVTLWDVLEHVPDPAQAIAIGARILKSNGMLFLNVPNVASTTARWLKSRWMLLLREHLWYFSPRTIWMLLNQNGFEVLSISPNRVTFSMRGIFARLLQSPRLASSHVLKSLARHSLLGKRLLTFGMGEMVVAAKLKPK